MRVCNAAIHAGSNLKGFPLPKGYAITIPTSPIEWDGDVRVIKISDKILLK
jgi:hypothetical protein